MKTLLVILMLLPIYAFSEKPSRYRQECAQTSQTFKENLTSKLSSVWCANPEAKNFGPMGADVIHAMVVAAFFEKRIDRRMNGMNRIEQYDCQGKESCKEFLDLLDWAIKSKDSRQDFQMVDRANLLRDKVSKKLEAL